MTDTLTLPTERKKAVDVNPKFLILYGKPKCGKTTIAAALDNNLIIDFERGSDSVDAMSIRCETFDDLVKIKTMIADKNKESGKNFYKYITLDTATALEEMIMPLAIKLYQKTAMGKNFKGDDVRTLPNGAGWLYVREAYKKVINGFVPLCDTLILLGHSADKLINKDGKDLSEMDFDLTGKLKRIMSARADAIGYIHRKKNQTFINFQGGEDFVVEARPLHLRGKEFVIAESDENNNIKVDWSQIFI